jgi:S1-C subfamily serine protease
MYAQRALEERFPDVGFGGEEVPLPRRLTGAAPEQVAIRITDVEAGGAASLAGLEPGDVLITVGGEPFFRGRGGVGGLHHWMVRELRATPADYELRVWRDGREATLSATYGLGPYRPAGP